MFTLCKVKIAQKECSRIMQQKSINYLFVCGSDSFVILHFLFFKNIYGDVSFVKKKITFIIDTF